MLKIQKLDFLISLYMFCVIVSELMGGKTFPITHIGSFVLSGSVAIFLVPIVYSVNDILTEVFGPNRARSVVRSGLFMVGLLFLFILLATHLPSSKRFLPMEKSYEMIFETSARIAISSLTAFALGEFLDVYIFAKLRKRFGPKKLWLRNNVSNFFSEGIDTMVFMTLAFYAIDKPFAGNFAFLIGLILPYWFLKCFMSVIETPFVYAGVKWLRDEKK